MIKMVKKYIVKPTEQYGKNNVPDLKEEKRACLMKFHAGKYPACKKHWALLCYQHDVWRCVECGFAVKW